MLNLYQKQDKLFFVSFNTLLNLSENIEIEKYLKSKVDYNIMLNTTTTTT